MQWFRMYAEAVDDDKLRLLAFEDRWHFVALLCLKAGGVLDSDPQTLDRRIAVKLGLMPPDLAEVKRRLREIGLIEESWQPLAWGKRQYESDHSGAERSKRWRRKSKRHGDVSGTSQKRRSDGPDTEQNRTDTEQNRKNPLTPKGGGFHADVIGVYHELLPDLPAVRDWPARRQKKLDARIADRLKAGKPADQLDYWRALFKQVHASDFLCGRKGDWRCPGLEWLLEDKNFTKVIEGAYRNNESMNGSGHAR
jgi:hypothetical protein